MLQSICILYYYQDETFDFELIGKNIVLSDDKKCITKMERGFSNNSYGIQEISSMSNRIYEWVEIGLSSS